jgi:hypothetical protein
MGFSIGLYLGPGAPAPPWMMASLDSVEVVQSDRAPNGFQLTFTTPRTATEIVDYQVLAAAQLQAGQRIIITAAVNGASQVLMDGFITRVQLQPPTPQEEARITVIGEDVSVMMDMYEYSLEYPYMPDSAIAALLLVEWMGLGVTPEVTVTATDMLSIFYVNQQVGTDRAYLNQLATQNAYVFCIRPGPVVGQSRGYWGPPLSSEPPQPVLTVDANGFGSVVSLSATFEATAPQLIYGLVQDTLTGLPLPAAALFSTRSAVLAAQPRLLDSFPMQPVRLFDHQGLNIMQAEMRAQAILNASTDQVVTLTGRLDALRYGSILTAPGVVGLRGVGYTFDGYYYVQKVVHSVSRGAYIQEFALAREGTGSTVGIIPSAQVTAGGLP